MIGEEIVAKEQHAVEQDTAEIAVLEEEQFELFQTDQFTNNSVEDWNIVDVLWRVLRDAGELDQHNSLILAELEIAYYRCLFDIALEKANYLIEHAEAPIAMYSRAMRMIIMTANGNGEEAYRDLLVLKDICKKGLAQRDDIQLFSASVISALRIESVLMASVFDLPDITEGVDEIPTGLKLYFGYLLAMRLLRLGRYKEAYGMAFSYLTIITAHFPSPRTYLYCVAASAKMLMGDVDRARTHFNMAWKLKEEHNIIMPFIELNYALLGLPRVNREELAAPEEVRRVDALISSFRKGWFYLRRKCGLSSKSEPLTPLECYASSLAALGWRNKEIAKHLLLSESTVKHQLSSAYQKLNISSRSELQKLYRTPPKKVQDFAPWV